MEKSNTQLPEGTFRRALAENVVLGGLLIGDEDLWESVSQSSYTFGTPPAATVIPLLMDYYESHGDIQDLFEIAVFLYSRNAFNEEAMTSAQNDYLAWEEGDYVSLETSPAAEIPAGTRTRLNPATVPRSTADLLATVSEWPI